MTMDDQVTLLMRTLSRTAWTYRMAERLLPSSERQNAFTQRSLMFN